MYTKQLPYCVSKSTFICLLIATSLPIVLHSQLRSAPALPCTQPHTVGGARLKAEQQVTARGDLSDQVSRRSLHVPEQVPGQVNKHTWTQE